MCKKRPQDPIYVLIAADLMTADSNTYTKD